MPTLLSTLSYSIIVMGLGILDGGSDGGGVRGGGGATKEHGRCILVSSSKLSDRSVAARVEASAGWVIPSVPSTKVHAAGAGLSVNTSVSSRFFLQSLELNSRTSENIGCSLDEAEPGNMGSLQLNNRQDIKEQ